MDISISAITDEGTKLFLPAHLVEMIGVLAKNNLNIAAIKYLRSEFSLSLRDAKDLVDTISRDFQNGKISAP
jgi:ribosomal protein L7/L12